jgi:hypothetical protein
MKSFLSFLAPFLMLSAAAAQTPPAKTPSKEFKVTWKKTVLDKKFRSEGAAAADINGDGKKDILVGDVAFLAPDWKQVVIRKDKSFDPKGYSESFAVFADDVDKDGLIDQIVVGFPGAPCYWYKNPGKGEGSWKSFMIQDNACNETPIYTDLLGIKKKGLILGHKGEMSFFIPGSDPTAPWTKISISGAGKTAPGTDKFAHGLGAGDVNGDGKLDVLCSAGWWEQPAANATLGNWKYHPLGLPACADMYAFDVDGDGKNDILSSSAHNTGIWWNQQKEGKEHPAFAKNLMFPLSPDAGKLPADFKLSKDEAEFLAAINKIRGGEKKAPWRLNAQLTKDARNNIVAASETPDDGKFVPSRVKYPGDIVGNNYGSFVTPQTAARELLDWYPKLKHPGLELGIGVVEANSRKLYLVLIGDNESFVTPGQTHALNFVDIDGDGKKDLVTGRRWWAHGPGGDDTPGDPAFLYWFKAKTDKSGFTTFDPQMIDDDSGIGTQFAVEDVDGDGLLDIIVSNKRGTFLFTQGREEIFRQVPPPPDE